jgi:hypothetical protein
VVSNFNPEGDPDSQVLSAQSIDGFMGFMIWKESAELQDYRD